MLGRGFEADGAWIVSTLVRARDEINLGCVQIRLLYENPFRDPLPEKGLLSTVTTRSVCHKTHLQVGEITPLNFLI